jgi:hypothetical protein
MASGVTCMTVTLLINPSTDQTFVDWVHVEFADSPTLAEFEGRIRLRYPSAAVRTRELSGEPFAVWYVYRDGSWTDPRIGGT